MATSVRKRITRVAATLAVGPLLVSCSSNPAGDFRDVRDTVAARSGGKGLHWMRGEAADGVVQQQVGKLLARQLTADRAAQVALLNNRSIQAELEEIGIARAEYLQALLPSNPSFSGFVRFPNRGPGNNMEGQVAVNILDLLLLPIRQKIAAAQLQAAKLSVAAEVLTIVTETKSAFYRLQARQQLIKRLKLIVQTNEAALDIAQRRHKAGNTTDLDLANQQALFSQSKVDLAKATTQVRSDRERLNRLMGLFGPALGWRVADELPAVPKSEVTLRRLEERAIAGRLDLALARANVASIGYALRVRGGTRFLPASINVGVNRERDVDRSVLTGPTLDVQVPLFDFGQAAIPKLEAQYRQAQHQLEALAVNARSEVREARDLLVASRELANFYARTLLPQRLQIVNQTALQYNAMQVGPVELLAAKERELMTERGYVDAWRDYWLARVELERALIGGGVRAMRNRGSGFGGAFGGTERGRGSDNSAAPSSESEGAASSGQP